MDLTPDELRDRLDAVASDAAAPPAPDLEGVVGRARRYRERRRRLAGAAACALVIAAIAGGLLVSRGADDGAVQSPSAPTTTRDGERSAVFRRDSPHGRLTVTRGPAVMSDRYDPFGPTDHWSERAECYAPRLYVEAGRFAGDVADTPDVMHGSDPAVYALTLSTERLDTSVFSWVVFRAGTGRTFRLSTPAGWTDETTSQGGVAVLVDRDLFLPTADPSTTNPLAVSISEVVDGRTVPIDLDVGSMEEVLYAGQANSCPEGPTMPSPTIPLEPGDADAAVAVAVPPFDPTVPVSAAAAGVDGERTAAVDRITEMRKEVARFEGYFGPGFRAGAVTWSTQSTTPGQIWVQVAPARADGTIDPVRSWWVKVRNVGDAWKVDPESLCNFLRVSIRGGGPVGLAGCPAEVPAGGE